jgi:hypothetical protein
MWRNIPWIRLSLSVVLLTAAFLHAKSTMADDIRPGELRFAEAFKTMIYLLSGCIVLSTVIRRQAARPFTGLIDKVYFGSDRQDEPPPLNVRLPRAYRAEGCYEKSIQECTRQMEWHALSPELWAELVLAYRGGRVRGGEAETAARARALECLGMTSVPHRFDKIVRERDNLPEFPAAMISQFER